MTTSYRVHGISDDTDTCEICGKTELRRVVMLAVLDADGNQEDLLYAGSTCAARKLSDSWTKIKASKIRDAAGMAATVWTQAREFVKDFEGITFEQYIEANQTAARNHGAQKMRESFAGLTEELILVKSGTLTGTRWEKKLPTL